MTAYPSAITALVQGLAAADTFNDPDLTREANGRKGAELAQAAVETFTAAIPPAPADLGAARAEHIANARPKTADQIAVTRFELDLVKDKLAAGQRLGEIVRDSTEPTLRALEGVPDGLTGVKGAPDGPKGAQTFQEQVFGILAQIEGSDAQIAAQRDEAAQLQNAWHRVMTDLLGAGPSMEDLVTLRTRDPEGYRAAFPRGIPSSLRATLRDIEGRARP